MDLQGTGFASNSNQKEKKKLSFVSYLAYGCGDAGCNVVYGMVGTLLTLFYTDYIGIPAGTIAIIMLISRVLDGVSDFVMGFIVERTHTKWGKARPWVLWMSVPYAVSGILLFTVPHTTSGLQFVYIFITYNLCTSIIYTAINLPYGSLSPMMTRSTRERDLLSVFRMGVAPFGRILVVSATMPIVRKFGDSQQGWIIAMTIWCVIGLMLLLFCFGKCKETVVIPAREKQAPVSIGKSLKVVLGNQYFWACLVGLTCQTCYTTVIGTMLPYYCRYILHNDGWMYSTLYTSETVITILFTFLTPILSKKYGKRNVIAGGLAVAIASQIVLCFSPFNFSVLLVTTIFRAIGISPLTALVFGLIGDAIEFGQWKTHVRQEALAYAVSSVGFKVGVGVVLQDFCQWQDIYPVLVYRLSSQGVLCR